MMQGDDVVSAIVPAHNAEATIGETLESALAQTYRKLEVIVVDDGSTDGTADIVRLFLARDPRVRLFTQGNAGVAAARNVAIAQSQGVYIAPLDADDLWHPEKIALQIEAMRRSGPRVGLVYCWCRVIDMAGQATINEWVPYPHECEVYPALVMGNLLASASIALIRRTDLTEVGGYDSTLRAQGAQGCEDLKLYLQLAERCEFALVRRYLVGYRDAPDSMSTDPRRMLRSHKLVLAEARRRHPELPGWLFRLGEARYMFYRGKGALRNGRPLLGIVLLLKAFGRDPAGIGYRLAEKPWGALMRWWRRKGSRPGLTAGGLQLRNSFYRDLLEYRPAANCVLRHLVASGEQPFFAAPTEPIRGAQVCSSLYSWRCEVAAAALVGCCRTRSACELRKGNAEEPKPRSLAI